MESLPVEVIGNILSLVGAARDVVIVSATCWKWREAFRNHLHTLSFNYSDWLLYHNLSTSTLEILITRTIFQTRGLQCLSIVVDDVHLLSAATVIAWLMYNRDTLRKLCYNAQMMPSINILEKCCLQKLEVLELTNSTIIGVEPTYQNFLCLKSLSLSYVSMSALDLSLLLTGCPKIEVLSVTTPDIVWTDVQPTIKLSSSSLKDIYVETISLDKFILEADSLEHLHLKDCSLELLMLIGKGALRTLKFDDTSILDLDIGERIENLEVVDISSFLIRWPKFFHMISISSKLRRLRLWYVEFDDDKVLELETISGSFPQLSHLSLSYDLRDNVLDYGLPRTSYFENLVVLELGWTIISDVFSHWVAGFLERCPSLKKLVIYGVVSETKTQEECHILATFTSSIVQLTRKYMHVEVHFEYE